MQEINTCRQENIALCPVLETFFRGRLEGIRENYLIFSWLDFGTQHCFCFLFITCAQRIKVLLPD